MQKTAARSAAVFRYPGKLEGGDINNPPPSGRGLRMSSVGVMPVQSYIWLFALSAAETKPQMGASPNFASATEGMINVPSGQVQVVKVKF